MTGRLPFRDRIPTVPDIREAETIPPPNETPVTMDEWTSHYSIFTELGTGERAVLRRIAERLLMGQRQYGLLAKRGRDWRKEAQMEALDMAVYMACECEEVP